MKLDWILRGGHVIDGTGAPARRLDVGIESDRIRVLGDLSTAHAENERDVSGFTITPGFIDAHSHSDAYLLIEPDAPSKLSQGITTEINGQCGGSAVPRFGAAKLSSDWASQTYPTLDGSFSETVGPTWSSVASYRTLFDLVKPAINTIQFIGHNTLRASVMGYAPRPASADETRALCALLEKSLDEGGWGLSTGLLYQPGKYSVPEEIQALASVAKKHGAQYATHMRSEGPSLLEAVDEVLDLARSTGIQVQISHLKTSGKNNWNKIEPLLEKLNNARESGIRLYSDRYPYIAAGTELDVVFPDWAGAGGRDPEMARLADPIQRKKIIDEINASGRDWNDVRIGGTWSDFTKPFSGKSIQEASETLNLTAGETIALFVEKDLTRTGGFFFGMSPANLHRIYEQPWITCGSDASLRAPTGPLGMDHPHPRAYGTFPRFFRLLTGRENGFSKICSDEEAIRRMTSLPAQIFSIRDRGTIRMGGFADLVILHPDHYQETATYLRPHQFSAGVNAVFVNGTLAYENGHFTGNRNGRFLER